MAHKKELREQVVEDMVESLKEKAEIEGVSIEDIRELFEEKRINELDELFRDGGEARCDHFTDIGMEYALEFGEIESEGFDNAFYEVVEKAMEEF